LLIRYERPSGRGSSTCHVGVFESGGQENVKIGIGRHELEVTEDDYCDLIADDFQ